MKIIARGVGSIISSLVFIAGAGGALFYFAPEEKTPRAKNSPHLSFVPARKLKAETVTPVASYRVGHVKIEEFRLKAAANGKFDKLCVSLNRNRMELHCFEQPAVEKPIKTQVVPSFGAPIRYYLGSAIFNEFRLRANPSIGCALSHYKSTVLNCFPVAEKAEKVGTFLSQSKSGKLILREFSPALNSQIKCTHAIASNAALVCD